MPSVPFAGPKVGFFAIPPVGANVWVEFEAGDTDHPIWSGCFWGPGQLPAEAADPTYEVWRTTGSVIVPRPPRVQQTVSPTPLEVRVNDDSVAIGRGDRPLVTVSDDAVSPRHTRR